MYVYHTSTLRRARNWGEKRDKPAAVYRDERVIKDQPSSSSPEICISSFMAVTSPPQFEGIFSTPVFTSGGKILSHSPCESSLLAFIHSNSRMYISQSQRQTARVLTQSISNIIASSGCTEIPFPLPLNASPVIPASPSGIASAMPGRASDSDIGPGEFVAYSWRGKLVCCVLARLRWAAEPEV